MTLVATVDERARGGQGVRLEGIVRRFGDVTAVDGVTLAVEPGRFFSLLGPSGCGKTTLLRIIAGLEDADRGSVWIGERDVTRLRPQARSTAMVFQNYALFPHMTVAENVGYGLRVRNVAPDVRRGRVERALSRVDLQGLGDRLVTRLSGGQQQRVALARAIAVEPDVLLFDEPLSNLDVGLRQQTRRELKLLQSELGTTSVYVTHDQEEALALSDLIGVMNRGRLLQVGSPSEVYRAPSTAFVAQFLGFNVIRHGASAESLAGEARPSGHALAVRPEHLRPAAEAGGSGLRGHILSRQFLGTGAEWWVDLGEVRVRLWLDPDTPLEAEQRIRAQRFVWVPDDLD